MKSILLGAAMVAAVSFATPAAAQVGVEANGDSYEDQWGGELGLGYAVHAGPVSLRAAAGAFLYQGDSSPYYMDDNGGSPRCRNGANGQYADKSNCTAIEARAYGRVEGMINTPTGFAIGVGVRISNEARPYGTAAFPLAPKLKLKGNAGPHYFAAGISFGF